MHFDTHNAPVSKPVWRLYEYALETIGDRLALIQWDSDLPVRGLLVDEARPADDIRGVVRAAVA